MKHIITLFCPHCGAANEDTSEHCFICDGALREDRMKLDMLLFGRYRVRDVLGQGGYGVVYKAEDTQDSDREVAIKVLVLQGLDPLEAQEAQETFQREMELLSQIAHPAIPALYASSLAGHRWYLVMDYINGETLETYLQKKGNRLSTLEVVQFGIQLSDILRYLHDLKPPIIFRDIKPLNIMRDKQGMLFLIDFGIARQFRAGKRKDTKPLGSPGYAAPEQYGKMQSDEQTDMYSLGTTLLQLLTGIDPTVFLDPLTVGRRVDDALRAISMFRPVPAPLTQLLQEMLSLQMNERPQTMLHVQKRLLHIEKFLPPERVEIKPKRFSSISRRRLMLVSAGVVTATAFAALVIPQIVEQYTASPTAPKAIINLKAMMGEPYTLPENYSDTLALYWGHVDGPLLINTLNGYVTLKLSGPDKGQSIVEFNTISRKNDTKFLLSKSSHTVLLNRGDAFFFIDAENLWLQKIGSLSFFCEEMISVAASDQDPDSFIVATLSALQDASEKQTISLYSYSNLGEIKALKTVTIGIKDTNYYSLSPNGSFLTVANTRQAGAIEVIPISDSASIERPFDFSRYQCPFVWASDDNHFAIASNIITSGYEHKIVTIGSMNPAILALHSYVLITKGNIMEMAWSPDNKSLAISDDQGYLVIWKSISEKEIQICSTIQKSILQKLAWSSDGHKIAATDGARNVFVWDVNV